MYGPRRSCQSNGSLIIDPKYRRDHCYYRASMNRNLLPYVQSYINKLQSEAMDCTYQSGESLMTLYISLLGIRDRNDLCQQAIITQSNFHNSLHIDKCCNLNSVDTKKVMTSESRQRTPLR